MNNLHGSRPNHASSPRLEPQGSDAADFTSNRRPSSVDSTLAAATGIPLPAPAAHPGAAGALRRPEPRYLCDAATSGTFGAVGGALAAAIPTFVATWNTPIEAGVLVTVALALAGATVGGYAARTPREDTPVGATAAATITLLALSAGAGLRVGMLATLAALLEGQVDDFIGLTIEASAVSLRAGVRADLAVTVGPALLGNLGDSTHVVAKASALGALLIAVASLGCAAIVLCFRPRRPAAAPPGEMQMCAL